MGFGTLFGAWTWIVNAQQGVATPTGTIMLAALPTLVGFQMLLSFVNYDIQNAPVEPLQRWL
jgi:dolichol-phosphate mannosyltransferase